MKCYFVYAIPSQLKTSLIGRIFVRLEGLLKDSFLGVFFIKRKYKESDFSNWPQRSPYENTKHIFLALNNKWETSLFHLIETTKIKFSKDDIFIGHPFFPVTNNNVGITENAITTKTRPRVTAIITPLHANNLIKTNHLNGLYIDHVEELSEKCDLLFTIMGEYWWDQFKISKYSSIKSKMIRLDMAIDINSFPRIKTQFAEKGMRKFLYIGKNDPLKGIDFLSKLANKYGADKFGWIGSGPEIEGIKKISDFRPLTKAFMTQIASEYDFFINPSVADANPTTILECLAWGFPVLATKQSGYYESEIISNVFLEDMEKSLMVLKKYDHMDKDLLHSISDQGRILVKEKYNWGVMTDIIITEIEKKYLEKESFSDLS